MTLRRLIQHNFWLKAMSVFLAIAVWFVIRVGIQSEPTLPSTPVTNPMMRRYELPVHVLTDPADAQIFQVIPETVVVNMTGERAVLEKYDQRDYKVYLDLTNPKGRETNMEVRVHVPAGVSVLGVLPRAVDLERISPSPSDL